MWTIPFKRILGAANWQAACGISRGMFVQTRGSCPPVFVGGKRNPMTIETETFQGLFDDRGRPCSMRAVAAETGSGFDQRAAGEVIKASVKDRQ